MRRTRPSGDHLSDDGAAFRYAGLAQQHRIADCDPVRGSPRGDRGSIGVYFRMAGEKPYRGEASSVVS